MGRDYRIGLVIGSVLAGIALLWVATRPSLGPRLPVAPSTDPNVIEAAKPVILPETGLASETRGRRTQDRGQKTEDGLASPSVPRRPSSLIQNLPSSSPNSPARGNDEPGKTTRFHIVHQGDTLSAIAQQYYGSTANWRKILAANEKTIKDANKLTPGTKLTIP